MKKLIVLAAALVMVSSAVPARAEERKSGWKIFKASAKIIIGTYFIGSEVKGIVRGLTMDKEAAIAQVNQWREGELNRIERERRERQEAQPQGEANQGMRPEEQAADDMFQAFFGAARRAGGDLNLRQVSVDRTAAQQIAAINNIGSFGIFDAIWVALGSAFIYSGYKDFTEQEEERKEKTI